jgi:DNA modification methylase
MGSGSLEVACIELGFDVVGIEINETYFNGALERIKTANKQRRLFD